MQTLLANDLQGLRVFAKSFENCTEYTRMTADVIAAALCCFSDDTFTKPTIIIDGLSTTESDKVKKRLKSKGIRYHKIRGMRDENSPILRLADSLAGLLRDASEGNPQSRGIAKEFSLLGILTTQK